MSRFYRFSLVVLTALVMGACASGSKSDADPSALYQDAEDDIRSDRFQIAVDKLRNIKNKFPYSSVAVKAQLRIADVYFLQESYAEAGPAYETFYDLHPKHEKSAYAMFMMAESNHMDIPTTIARDLAPAHKAVLAYGQFLERFPLAPQAPMAKHRLDTDNELLAQKELYIGDFYLKLGQPASAKGRYLRTVDQYPSTESAQTAKRRLEKLK